MDELGKVFEKIGENIGIAQGMAVVCAIACGIALGLISEQRKEIRQIKELLKGKKEEA